MSLNLLIQTDGLTRLTIGFSGSVFTGTSTPSTHRQSLPSRPVKTLSADGFLTFTIGRLGAGTGLPVLDFFFAMINPKG